MIVEFSELSELRGKVAMVDGAFDPLHQGHVEYFAKAAELGLPLICCVASDAYVSTKHRPLLSEQQRLRVIDALKPITYVVLNQQDTETVLEALQPRCYVKGDDWKGRLPERQVEICRQRGIEIVYLDTVRDSSSRLLRDFSDRPDFGSQVEAFEDFVQGQTHEGAEHYDEDYFFNDESRTDHLYTVENRRKMEGRNPQLIRDVFQAKTVVDMGCGPGALLTLLDEFGVKAEGVDFSEECKRIAPETVRDRIHIGSVTDIGLPDNAYELVICREVFEHLTVLQVQQAVANLCRISSRFIYLTTRFHPAPETFFDVTTEFDVDPTHITLMNQDTLRLLFVFQGFRRRRDLEGQMDWLDKRRVLVYEKPVHSNA